MSTMPSEAEILERFREPDGLHCMARLIETFLHGPHDRPLRAFAALVLACEEYDARGSALLLRRAERAAHVLVDAGLRAYDARSAMGLGFAGIGRAMLMMMKKNEGQVARGPQWRN
jgi:hypothetical protein